MRQVKMQAKSKIVLLLTILILISITLGCGTPKSGVEVDESRETIYIQSIGSSPFYLKDTILRYEMTHKDVHFEILDDIDYFDNVAKNKVFNDISRGKGPDILSADRENLATLAEKGCLMDLSDTISEEEFNLLDSFFKYGSLDGKLYLTSHSMNYTMLATLSENIDEDNWTISGFIDAIEEKEISGHPYEWVIVRATDPAETEDLFDVFMRCIDASNFIDWEKKTCHFDSPLFIKVLNISKKYNEKASKNPISEHELEKQIELLREGKVLALYNPVSSLNKYSETNRIIGNDAKFIGYPSDKDNGMRIVYAESLGINKKSNHKDAIIDFIKYFYSYENSCELWNEVRTDIYEDRIEFDEMSNKYVIQKHDNEGRLVTTEMVVKENGEDYSDEYYQYLERFVVADFGKDRATNIIKDIIYEEAESYFNGAKSAEEVAKLIQSRISILLSE